MRLITYEGRTGPCAGVLVGEDVVPALALDSSAGSVRGLLSEKGPEELRALGQAAAEHAERLALSELRLLAPVPNPEKIICLGPNYRDHAEETGREIPAAPMWFGKFANSLIGSGQEIRLPAAHPDYVDYEAELAVVIGRTTRDVDADGALAHVAGAIAFNDISARDLQLQNPLWTSGKAIDTFAPCGPSLVTLDEIDDLQNLELRTRINGETVQQGNTANQIFTVAQTVAWLSRTITLTPGDIIATGTPAGIGAIKGHFLRPGDVVEVEVDRIGTISNTVRGP